MAKLSDQEVFDKAKEIASGRTALEMGQILHAAHEVVLMEEERAKHDDVKTTIAGAVAKGVRVRSDGMLTFNTDAWDALKVYLLDGEGSNHVDVIVGAALAALLNDDQEDFEFKLRLLFKAALSTFPHVKQQVA